MTAPLVLSNVDLRDFAFMPLDVVRLRDSGLTAKATGDEFRAAVLLWCASWHQVPAASLPNDDAELANLCGYGRALREWQKIKTGALRGWLLCDDGRFYHPIIAEKANEAWATKSERMEKDEAERDRKRREREDRSRMFTLLKDAGVTPAWNISTRDLRALVTDLSRGQVPDSHASDTDASRLRQGQGQGQGIEKEQKKELPKSSTSGSDSPPTPEPDPIFGHGLAFMLAKGVPERGARSFLGAMRKEVGDVRAAELLASAEREDVSDPTAWLRAAAGRDTRQKSEPKRELRELR